MKSTAMLAAQSGSSRKTQGKAGKDVRELLVEFEKTPEGSEVRMAIEAMRVASSGASRHRNVVVPVMTGGYYRLDD